MDYIERKRNSPGVMSYTVEGLASMVDSYFEHCAAGKKQIITRDGVPMEIDYHKPMTIAGLCAFLGIATVTWRSWRKRGDNYSAIVEYAGTQIEAWNSEALYDKEMHQGAKFCLQAIHQWRADEGVAVYGDSERDPVKVAASIHDVIAERRVSLLESSRKASEDDIGDEDG